MEASMRDIMRHKAEGEGMIRGVALEVDGR